VVAALVAEDNVLLLEAAANANVEVLVPPAVLVDAIPATVEGSGTGVDVAMNPVVLDDVDASTLGLTAVADDGVLLLKTCVDGVAVAVLVILEVVTDVNTSVVAALVAEDNVLPLEAAANADVEVLVPSAVLVNAVSATIEGSGVLVFTALAVLDVDGDELLDSARAEVLVGKMLTLP